MADSKISQLTSATTPLAGTEVAPIVQSGATKKVPVSDLTTGRAVSAKSLSLSENTTGVVSVMTNTVTSGWADIISAMKAALSSNTYDVLIDLVENNGIATEWVLGSFVNIPVYIKTNDTLVLGILTNGNVSVLQAGKGVTLKSPDGNTTKTLTINNSGNLVVA